MAIPTFGEPAPWFTARSPSRPDFQFSQAAGRHVVLSFIGSAGSGPGAELAQALEPRLFDDSFAALFLVSADPQDEAQKRIGDGPGRHVFWDSDGKVAELYGLTRPGDGGAVHMTLASFVLDPLLRVVAVLPLNDPAEHAQAIADILARQPQPAAAAGPVPVLLLPRVFEPEFCRRLIGLYDADKSTDSGFMRTDPRTGKTVLVNDHAMKRRRDYEIMDEAMRRQIAARLSRRLVPEIKKVFQFEVTRIERYIVAQYDAETRGHFRAHRDNTTKGTAHRRFAVTLNLNAEDYEGGDLVFPEFGRRTWRAPTGGAVVFSCSLLHEAQPVTKGVRYACLPFLYDEAAAKIRAENLQYLDLKNA